MLQFLKTLLRIFLVGVVAVLPFVITMMVVIWVSGYLTSLLGPHAVLGQLLRRMGWLFVSSDMLADLVGWLIVLSLIFGLGLLVEFGARRLVYDRFDRFAERVPVLGGIYGTARQLVGMIDAKGNPDFKTMQVVFCNFGGERGAAFLALLPTPERFRIGDTDFNAVLIPSAPVPVGGSLLFVPASSVTPAGLSVDAFMSIYVSMGVTGPQFLKPVDAASPKSKQRIG
ncbi:MAG: DUF502 domain-containing protein [Planctomycetes bacterium]|nr:DUF502 domain-containing protein [Planctomycetota bacterium]